MKKDQTQDVQKNLGRTQQKDDLLNQIADREEQIRIKGRLMDNMAYQIRTLSNAVIGFSELLLSEELSQDQIEYIREISDAGYGLSALVNEVLEWNQVLSGNLEVRKTKCDLSDIMESVEQTLAEATLEKGLDYKVISDPMLPAQILTDQERLSRCLLNLIANAVTYTSEGSVRVHAMTEENNDLGPVARFDVIDSGTGIDEQALAHIFESHDYQIGTDQGLLTFLNMGFKVTAGLSLTNHLIKLLGGTIDVASQVGVGSTFSLRVPVGINADGQSLEQLSAKEGWQKMDMASGTLLLVEDQQANRTVISLMLEALGINVETAVDGKDALSKIENKSYSLILMDLKMPEMDGFEVTRKIRDKGILIPIIALSAKVLDSDEHRQISEMFDGFLAKPVDSRNLAKMLGNYVKCSNASPEQDAVVLEYEH